MGRHELREQIFLLLFRVEFHVPEDMPQQMRLFFEDGESTASEKDKRYISEKYQGILEKQKELDTLLGERAQKWDVDRMGKVELAILRLAVYEILYDEDIPASVAINEAVEIAKKYGQESSGAFVNAVLAKFVE